MEEHQYARDVLKKKREIHNCCVPQCSEVETSENHLHTVPKDPERRRKWALAIKTGKGLSDKMQVCRKHFKPDDCIPTSGSGLRPNLKKTAVPSLNLPIRSHDRKEPSPLKRKKEARCDRTRKRAVWSNTSLSPPSDENEPPSSGDDRSVNGQESDMAEFRSEDTVRLQEVGVQVHLDSDSSAFVTSILSSDKRLFTSTGLHSVKLLNSITTCFDKIAPESPQKKFSVCTRDRIILTMMTIKSAISFSALAVIFDLCIQTCAYYFYDTMVILSKILKCIVLWPDQGDIMKNMPKCFASYKCTRVVLDYFEIPIQKAKCIKCRVRSYSHYKKNHTAQLSMTITPSGLICLVSAAFGGRASDKVITSHSGIYQLCDPGDGIMVDKGYNIEEECQDNFITLIRPPFLRQSKKFSKAEFVQCTKFINNR